MGLPFVSRTTPATLNPYLKKEEELNKLKSKTTESIKVHLVKEVPVAAIEYSMKK